MPPRCWRVGTGPVELLTDAAFPAPVRAVRLTLRRDTGDGPRAYRFDAEIRIWAGAGVPLGLLALGAAGPIGVLLLTRRLAAA
ncbi:hypothetical protein JNW88_15255, partial [Micromonospora sp. ATA32]|nr:hypothetical protein [Micromonospora sp. ATA32]